MFVDAMPAGQQALVSQETAAEREQRLAWEAADVAEALAEYDAGFYVDGNDVRVWLDSIGTGVELPLPPVGQL